MAQSCSSGTVLVWCCGSSVVGCGGAPWMRTCLYSLTIHFLLTEVLRHVVPVSLQYVRTHPQLPCRPAWWGEPWEPWASNHRRTRQSAFDWTAILITVGLVSPLPKQTVRAIHWHCLLIDRPRLCMDRRKWRGGRRVNHRYRHCWIAVTGVRTAASGAANDRSELGPARLGSSIDVEPVRRIIVRRSCQSVPRSTVSRRRTSRRRRRRRGLFDGPTGRSAKRWSISACRFTHAGTKSHRNEIFLEQYHNTPINVTSIRTRIKVATLLDRNVLWNLHIVPGQ